MVPVRYYRTASGTEPVSDYLRALPAVDAAAVYAALRQVSACGVDSAAVTTRHVEGKLWEIKVSAQRVFYVVVTGPEIVLLHAYRKQSQKAPRRELDVARRRARETLAEAVGRKP